MSGFVLAIVFLFSGALAAAAQNATATVRLAPGQTATVTAIRSTGELARLEIALPKSTQRFQGIGEQLLPIKAGGKDSIIVAADLNGDGIDEILVHGSVSADSSALIWCRWDAQRHEFLPVYFSGDNQEIGRPQS